VAQLNAVSHRWVAIAESEYPWERAALSYVREQFPDQDPFRAWSNFEFVAEDGSINEVDLLVVSPYKIYLVEIKSRPGRLTGDTGTWTWVHEGRVITEDNPLLLANRKAKKLKSLLQHQKALRSSRVPYIEPVIFLSAPGLRCELSGAARTGVYLRDNTEREGYPDITAVLMGASETTGRGTASPPPRIDRRGSQAISRAVDQAGIRPSQRARRVGDYTLDRLLAESDVYQDWEATHVSFPKIKRRVRIYPYALQATELSRSARRQAAEREYLLLEGINHAGILKALEFHEHERGPALIFEHDPGAERLDLFLRDKGETLDIDMRLTLVRQLAETLQHAHERRLYHRAFSPQTILVTALESAKPQTKIFNWQTARREGSTEGSSRPATVDSLHLELFGDPHSLIYMAPEAIAGTAFDAPKLDIFGLGAVAYHLFSGCLPATSIQELQQKCEAGHGLRISDVLDGAGQELVDLIQFSTCPNTEDRLDTVREFLDLLEGVEEELTAPESEAFVRLLEAHAHDTLEGGFVVKKRLGKGGTSLALLVERDGKEGVLKVALDPDHNPRMIEEGLILRQLRHPNIVELYEQTNVSGHAALFMAVAGVEIKAGAYTLAQRIRYEGRLSLDLLQRFGEELLTVTHWLEQNGVSHRDIKPDNIGVGELPSRRLTLILFDFSLAHTPVDNIRAGTPPYLDPFLRRRKPPRWDLYAERFAVAMTLYEMATGTLPIWGDGVSDPSMLACEVSLDSDLFDPAVRDDLVAFFTKALHSDYRQRFDNAEEMLHAWRRSFMSVDQPTTETDHGPAVDLEQMMAAATEETPLSTLGLSPRLLDALSRMGAQTVGELLRLPRIRLYRNQGLGQRTVKDIRHLAERMAQYVAERGEATLSGPPEEVEPDETRADPRLLSVDFMARLAVPQRIDADERTILLTFLGLDTDSQPGAWCAQQDVAEQLGVTREAVQHTLHRARERRNRQPWMTALREDVAKMIDKTGGVMTTHELATSLLAARGSAANESDRSRFAAAVAYAAVETEVAREGARYILYRGPQRIWVVATPSLAAHYTASSAARAQYAEHLGSKADALAAADPLLTPVRVVEELQAVPQPEGDPMLTPDRLLRLAVASSQTAALSSRMELYPQHMEAARALKLGIGSLLGPKALTVRQIQQRIASRYPLAESVPGPPALDDLLREAGIELLWDGTGADGKGVYRPKYGLPNIPSTSSTLPRLSTAPGPGVATSPEVEAAFALEARLQQAVAAHRFLILTVAPKHLLRAEAEMVQRFPVTRISLEALLIEEMKAIAAAAGAKWDVVLKADAAAHQSTDWRRLQLLVRQAMPAVERALLTAEQPVLLVYPGLLARYDQMQLLETLRDACIQRHDVPGYMVLVASDEQRPMPVLDDKPIPVIHASEWARIPEFWLVNAHRAQA
jgi:serine/threonine protein kinase